MPEDKSSAPVPDIAVQTIALTDLTAVDRATLTLFFFIGTMLGKDTGLRNAALPASMIGRWLIW